jgi:hypothetical protein
MGGERERVYIILPEGGSNAIMSFSCCVRERGLADRRGIPWTNREYNLHILFIHCISLLSTSAFFTSLLSVHI